MQVTPEEIPTVSRLVDELCGVVLDETKGYLIDSRLGSVAEAAGCSDFITPLGVLNRPPDRCQSRCGVIVNVASLVDRIANHRGDGAQIADASPERLERRRCSPHLVQPTP